MFSDFNHVVSNMSYWVFGLAFIALVYLKSIRLPERHHPKNDHHTNTGILQQLSIFYVSSSPSLVTFRLVVAV